MSLVIPTQIAAGALGMGPDWGRDVGPGGFRKPDRVDLAVTPGDNNEKGTRIALRRGSGIPGPHGSGVSTPTPTPGHAGAITRGCILPLPMRPMSAILMLYVLEGDLIGEDVHDTVQSGGSKGERP